MYLTLLRDVLISWNIHIHCLQLVNWITFTYIQLTCVCFLAYTCPCFYVLTTTCSLIGSGSSHYGYLSYNSFHWWIVVMWSGYTDLPISSNMADHSRKDWRQIRLFLPFFLLMFYFWRLYQWNFNDWLLRSHLHITIEDNKQLVVCCETYSTHTVI